MSVIARPVTVVLLGGESTGKSTLTQALLAHLQAKTHLHAVAVPERLRLWCEAAGRPPRREEQAGIAAMQTLDISAACALPGVQVVLADTAALMVAAYSEQYFADASLWPQALRDAAGIDLILLMGLDLPWVPDGLFRDSPRARETTDALLRRRLSEAARPFQTVYGRGEVRLQQALRALGPLLRERFELSAVHTPAAFQEGNGRWLCDRCSEPLCERRLFSGLL